MSKLSKMKPVAVFGALNDDGSLRKRAWPYRDGLPSIPDVSCILVPLARYRADQRLIKAAYDEADGLDVTTKFRKELATHAGATKDKS